MSRTVVLLMCALPQAACSIPLAVVDAPERREFLVGFHSVNADASRSRRVVLGLDIRADSIDGGLSVGASDLRRLEARKGVPASYEPRTGYVFPLGYRWKSGEDCNTVGAFVHAPPRAPAGAAFVHHLAVGVLVDVAEWLKGFTVGYAGVTRVHVPPTSDGAYLLDYRTFDFGSSTLQALDRKAKGDPTKEAP